MVIKHIYLKEFNLKQCN